MGLLSGAQNGLLASAAKEDERVSLGDIESRLRSIGDEAQGAISASSSNLMGAVALAVVALVGVAYLHGRRRGRRRASVLEIRRV